METRYNGTIGNDKITIDEKVASNDIIAYRTIFGGNYLARITGNQILHAPDGDWSRKFSSDRIDYIFQGQRYVAKFENGQFIHARDGDFMQTHPSKLLDYQDWDGNRHFVSLDQNRFSEGHPTEIHIVDGKKGNDEIEVHGGGYTVRGGDGDDTLTETSLPDSNNSNRFEGGAGFDKIIGGTGDDAIGGGGGNDTLFGDTQHIFAPAIAAYNGFNQGEGGYEGWSSFDQYPRQLADVNGDGLADIVGFGHDSTIVALGLEDGSFSSGKNVGNIFAKDKNSGGWSSFDQYPRQLADVNGDGLADIVGFGHDSTIVALGQKDGSFSSGKNVGNIFAKDKNSGGWSSFDQYPRQLADVNGDGLADIVGFGHYSTIVALGQKDGSFGNSIVASQEFSANHWASFKRSPRQVGDVNGDGRADIIGFGEDAVLVAYGKIDGTFYKGVYATNQFQPEGRRLGWYSSDKFPRQIADVNGDGQADIVGFSSKGVSVALSQLTDANDTLRGERGNNDTLSGGGGNDTFIIDDINGVDTITDFLVGDSFEINALGFDPKLELGELDSSRFLQGTDALAAFKPIPKGVPVANTDHRFIYNQGKLYFDMDGLGLLKPKHIATLNTLPKLKHSDIKIVKRKPVSDSDFNIEVKFIDSSFSESQKAIFTKAANRWSEVITGDLPDIFSETDGLVDDIIIDANAEYKDGRSGTLASAIPTRFRKGERGLPYRGKITVDIADLSNSQLEDIIIHEMGHAIGFHLDVFDKFGLLEGGRFNGANAVKEYNNLGGIGSSIPLDNKGQGHWNEDFFKDELMTPTIGKNNPISRLTIASLADLGYTVDMGAADPYSLPKGSRGASSLLGASSLQSSGNISFTGGIDEIGGFIQPKVEILMA